MTRELVFVHGMSQEHKDPGVLKKKWIDALNAGLAKSKLTLPIPETDIRFPFYGDTLFDLGAGISTEDAAEVIVRGDETDAAEKKFILAVVEEIRRANGITDEQLAEVADQQVIEMGPLNWLWVRATLQALDRFIPHASSATIAVFTHQVYDYLTNAGIRQVIEEGVADALTPGVETVVVAHSLGTIVAYNLLRREGQSQGWKVPQLVTLGSPLAITAVRSILKTFAPTRTPECVGAWLNAMDSTDVVALYPLDPKNFPIDPPDPAIENMTNVKNSTENRHGICGYLDDEAVASRIHGAL